MKFSGIKSLSISKESENFKDNQFIQNIGLNSDKSAVALSTIFGLVVEFYISDLFCVELIDLEDSEFGKGISSAKHGFTKAEWNEYLKKEKYVC